MILDGSIGPEPYGTLVPSGSYDSLFATYLITQELGEQRGGNLFHSFLSFGLIAGQSASFVDTAESGTIDNIVARVTGGRSEIDGLIRSQIVGASLFLLNPAGFMFTENATLDLAGSGYFSTAPLLRFPDTTFEAGEAVPPVQLSSADPAAFGFRMEDPAARIDLRLRAGFDTPVPDSDTLAFVGGAISIEGDEFTTAPTIRTGGTLALAAVASADADVPTEIDLFDVSDFAPGELGAVRISDDAHLNLSGEGGAFSSGRVVIRGGSFVLGSAAPDEAGEITACFTETCAGGAAAHDLVVDVELAGDGDPARADFRIEEGSSILLLSLADPLGDVRVEAPSLAVRGTAGDGIAEINTVAGGTSSKSSNITLIGDQISILDGGEVRSTNSALGTAGGTIRLSADEVTVANRGVVRSLVAEGAEGGGIEVYADDVSVDGGLLASGGAGAGGEIDVHATRDVTVRGFGRILSGEKSFGLSSSSARPGGDVRVSADRILVRSTDSDQPVSPSEISAVTLASSAAAPSGDVILTAREVVLEGGLVVTSTDGPSDAGRIQISGPLQRGAEVGELVPAELLRIEGETQVPGELPGVTLSLPAGLFARTRGSGSAGSIQVAARNVEVRAGGVMSARAAVGADGNAGSIGIEQAERVLLTSAPSEGSGFEAAPPTLSVSSANGSANAEDAGSIMVESDLLELLAGGGVVADSTGSAPAGAIFVDARAAVFDGVFTPEGAAPTESGLFSQSASAGSGNAGDVTVRIGERLTVSNGAQISVEAVDESFAGDITIEGSFADVILTGGAAITATVGSPDVPGPGDDPTADIIIGTVGSLSMDEGSSISVETDGTGQGGVAQISTRQGVSLANGARISSRSLAGTDGGPAGDILISALDLSVDSTAAVTAETAGDGEGGLVDIAVRRQATLSAGGRVTSSSSGTGAAGDVVFRAADLLIDGGGLPPEFASGIAAETSGRGAGGDVTVVTTSSTTLERGGRISSSSLGEQPEAGDAGDVLVDGGRQLVLSGGSSITTDTFVTEVVTDGQEGASGGKITLRATELIYLEDSEVSTSVFQGAGGGGDIGIPNLPVPEGAPAGEGEPDAVPPELLVLNRSTIKANAEEGPGGNILIAAGTIFRSTESVIEAKSNRGIDGNVDISAPDSDLAGQVTPLTTRFFDASELMLPACAARTSRAGSFTIQTRAVQPPPDAPLPASMAISADPTRGAACST